MPLWHNISHSAKCHSIRPILMASLFSLVSTILVVSEVSTETIYLKLPSILSVFFTKTLLLPLLLPSIKLFNTIFNSALGVWATKCKKFVGHNPTEISILNFLKTGNSKLLLSWIKINTKIKKTVHCFLRIQTK